MGIDFKKLTVGTIIITLLALEILYKVNKSWPQKIPITSPVITFEAKTKTGYTKLFLTVPPEATYLRVDEEKDVLHLYDNNDNQVKVYEVRVLLFIEGLTDEIS